MGEDIAYDVREAEAFARRYAERSGVTVEWLRAHGQIAVPCRCDYDGCEGWQMATHWDIGDAP